MLGALLLVSILAGSPDVINPAVVDTLPTGNPSIALKTVPKTHESSRYEIKLLGGGDLSFQSGSNGTVNPFALVEAHLPVFIGTSNPVDIHIESKFGGSPGTAVNLQALNFQSVDFEGSIERNLSAPNEPTHLMVLATGRIVSRLGSSPQPLNQTPASGFIEAKVVAPNGGEVSAGIGFTSECGQDGATAFRIKARAPIISQNSTDASTGAATQTQWFYIGGSIIIPIGSAPWNVFTNQGRYGVVTEIYTTVNLGALYSKVTS